MHLLKECPRLRFAGEQAERLGIDDPVKWLDTIPPSVLDFWFALHIVRAEDTASDPQAELMKRYG